MDRPAENSTKAVGNNSQADADSYNTKPANSKNINRKNAKICSYYSNYEFCRFGDNCKFLHKRQYASKQYVSRQHTSSRNETFSTNNRTFPKKEYSSNVPQNLSTSKKPCRYYKAGTCDRGDKCLFSHTFENPQQYAAMHELNYKTKSNSGILNKTKKSLPTCRYFKRGFCKDGNQCKFYHPQQTSNSKEDFKSQVHHNDSDSSPELNSCDQKDIAPTSSCENEEEYVENNSENVSLKNIAAENKSDDSNNYTSIENNELCKSENVNLKECDELIKQIDSTNSTVASNSLKNIKMPLSAKKVFSLSLTEDEISKLRLTELTQFKKRFPSYEVIEEDAVFAFTFQPSDPDWAFDLKELKIEVKFPEMYPKEVCRINVLRTEDYIPEPLFRHLNQSICDWLSNRHKAAFESEQVELLFRPFLKWFDKNVESIFNVGLKREKLKTESTTSNIQLSTSELTSTSTLSTSDALTENENLENIPDLSTQEEHVTKCISQVSISQKRNVPTPSSCTAQNQGVKVLFIGLEFIEGVGALSCTRVAAMLRCIRCKTSHNVKSPPNKNMAVTCSKCSKRLESNFNPSLLHQFSNVLGTMHLVECQVVDINLVESAFLIDCLNCSKQVAVNGIHYGQKQKLWCMFCNQKLVISIGSVKFQASAPTLTSTKVADKAVKKTEKIKDSVIKQGAPLPQFGACKHYKKSNRWLRFPCCGRVYPCDVCHEEKEMDHEMKFASRMICGFCSKEQPYSKDKPCTSCASGMVAKSGTHWEGGKGCRNKVKMARDDKHKYAGASKTVSKKAQSSGNKKK